MIDDITSAPITSTFLCDPVATNCAPLCNAYTNAEQAADRSNPQTFFAPSLCWTRQAVEGNNMSGVTVPTMIAPRSDGRQPRSGGAFFAASTARSLVATPLAAR